MEFLRDMWGFLRVRKKFWLLPIMITLLLLGAIIVFTGGSAIAPFIYTYFKGVTDVRCHFRIVGILPR